MLGQTKLQTYYCNLLIYLFLSRLCLFISFFTSISDYSTNFLLPLYQFFMYKIGGCLCYKALMIVIHHIGYVRFFLLLIGRFCYKTLFVWAMRLLLYVICLTLIVFIIWVMVSIVEDFSCFCYVERRLFLLYIN